MLEVNNLGIVIVDMQEYFLDRIQDRGMDEIINNHIDLLERAREHDVPVLAFEYSPLKKRNTIFEVAKGIRAAPRHIILEKREWNGFAVEDRFSLRPERWLRGNEVGKILITGLFASCCVILTALGAKQYGFEVVSSTDLIYFGNSRDEIVKDYNTFRIDLIPYPEIIKSLP